MPLAKESTNVITLSSRRYCRTKNIQDETSVKKEILVVRADNTIYRILEEFVSYEKAHTYATTSSEKVLDQIESIGFNLVILFNHSPKVDALRVIILLRFIATHSTSKFLVLHDEPDWELTVLTHDISFKTHQPTSSNLLGLKTTYQYNFGMESNCAWNRHDSIVTPRASEIFISYQRI